MKQNCWTTNNNKFGFLMNPDPIYDLRTVETPLPDQVVAHLQQLADTLPDLIKTHNLRPSLSDLATYEMSPLQEVTDFRIHERIFQIYAHLANAYVWCEQSNPLHTIPAGVAVPLVELAHMVDRPPIVPYASTALCNFQRIDPDGKIAVENLRCVQKLIDIPDESWFHLIHVEIEAHAGAAIQHCIEATEAINTDNTGMIEQHLEGVTIALAKMEQTFKRMPEGCSPDIYYKTLRPYLFGFDDVIYEGVAEFNGKPQTFRGETGAQSTVIPALQRYLGLQHEHGGLSSHMQEMIAYMPRPHRELLRSIDEATIRNYVINQQSSTLNDIYNACLQGIAQFRSLHLHMAQAYIASKVEDPRGTGGTEFMFWLKQLRDETEKQYIH
ncbi:MAG: hypothetical protein ACPG7F_01020 [Aggregatilineales bacterium]